MADLSIAGIVALQAVDFESWSAWKDSGFSGSNISVNFKVEPTQ
jgi:hypothetical protein